MWVEKQLITRLIDQINYANIKKNATYIVVDYQVVRYTAERDVVKFV